MSPGFLGQVSVFWEECYLHIYLYIYTHRGENLSHQQRKFEMWWSIRERLFLEGFSGSQQLKKKMKQSELCMVCLTVETVRNMFPGFCCTVINQADILAL